MNEISPLVGQVIPSQSAKSHYFFDAHVGIYSVNVFPSYFYAHFFLIGLNVYPIKMRIKIGGWKRSNDRLQQVLL